MCLFSSLVTGPSLMSISSMVLELWQFSFTRDWPEIQKSEIPPVWVLANIWSRRQGKDTKYGTNVSNKMLLNATKCQGYSFYRFCVIKGKPTREVGGKLPLPPPLTQITLYSCCSILFYFPTSKVSIENLSVLNRFFETYALTVQFCGSQFSITLW